MTASTGAAVDIERRAALNVARLSGLVAGRWGAGDRRSGAVGTTATLIEDPRGSQAADDSGDASAGRRRGWVLPDGDAARALGPAMVWADRHEVAELHLLAEPGSTGAGALARQAALFADGPAVWAIEGTTVRPAARAPASTHAEAPAPPDIVDLLIDAGLEIVVEGGMVRGEIDGLEVARIVHGHTTSGEPIDAPQLEVGVGKADRELTAMVHAGLPPVDQLDRVVEIVRAHRRPDAPRHPLNQLVPDRWLRAVLCRAPELVGLRRLRPAEGAQARPNLSERDVALAVGQDADGAEVLVACSVGIAPDLVPTAADGRAAIDAGHDRPAGSPPSRLLLALPARDDHPSTRRLAARLAAPAEVVPVPGDWRAAG